MTRNISCACVIVSVLLVGCQTASTQKAAHLKESNKEILGAVSQVAGALTGQELTDEQKKKLAQDIQNDKDAQTALRSIAGAMNIKQTTVKYCPVDGKRYSADLQLCPVHKIKLEQLVN